MLAAARNGSKVSTCIRPPPPAIPSRILTPVRSSVRELRRREPPTARERSTFARSTCDTPTWQRKPQDRTDPHRLRGSGELPIELPFAGKRMLRRDRKHRTPLEEDDRCPLGKILSDGRRGARSAPALALWRRRRPSGFRRLDRPHSTSAPDDRQRAASGDRLYAQTRAGGRASGRRDQSALHRRGDRKEA